MDPRQFIFELENVKDLTRYKMLLKKLKLECDNDFFVYTLECVKMDGIFFIIPLVYQKDDKIIWVCFSSQEIFKMYSDRIKEYGRMIDPLKNENISEINKQIILLMDKKFNSGKISKALYDKGHTLSPETINTIVGFIDQMSNRNSLQEGYTNFLGWYDDQKIDIKELNEIVQDYKCATKELCVKDLLSTLKKIVTMETRKSLEILDETLEEEEEEDEE